MNQSVNSEQLTSFAGKAVIVTGAGHGFGRAISLEFVRYGAKVMATDLLAEELEETQRLVRQMAEETGSGGEVEVFAANLTDAEQVEALVCRTQERFGTVHILVNNAGGVAGQVYQPVELVTDAEWEQVVAINLKAVFYTIRAVAPLMKEQRYGRIVNISSGAGRSYSLTGIQAYASSKAGQIGLTRQMARELGPYGITVNNVAPGFVRSNPATEKQWHAMGEEGQQRVLDGIALHRLGTPEEIARPVLFFASEWASYISGQVISVDGGHHMF
jgi:3-oxoacyl-[acyl-carrier protein] reductase